MITISSIFEMLFLIGFGLSWPMNIVKYIRGKTIPRERALCSWSSRSCLCLRNPLEAHRRDHLLRPDLLHHQRRDGCNRHRLLVCESQARSHVRCRRAGMHRGRGGDNVPLRIRVRKAHRREWQIGCGNGRRGSIAIWTRRTLRSPCPLRIGRSN